jgi:hypothetical protein
MTHWRTALLVTALALTTVSAAQAGQSAATCAPKTKTAGGTVAVVFCGPAVATTRAVGRTFRIVGGTCVTQGKSFFAQVGTIGGPKQGALQKSPLFYLLFNPGTPSTGAILYWIVDGKRYRAGAGAHIALQGRKVTFSGQLAKGPAFSGSGAFSGTLACGA